MFALLAPLFAWAGGGAFLVDVHGSINPGSAAYILDSLKLAQDAHADLFVIKLDTPGGLVASTRTIIQGISSSEVPVAVWVAPSGASATSAGALVALSAHVVAMQNGTNIGAAHPVGGAGEDIKGVMGEKVTNDTAALARAQAALRGRNVEVAEQIVTRSHSFSAAEAVEKHIADFLADDTESLLHQLSGRTVKVASREVTLRLPPGTPVSVLAMTSKQQFLHFMSDPNVSAVLLSLGGLAIWAEVSSGFSSIAAGVVGVLCFILGFISLQTLPVSTGGAILLYLGFALLVLDAFATNHGLLSVAALISILLGGLFLIDPASGSMHVSIGLLLPLVAALGLVVGLTGYVLSRDRGAPREGNALVGAHARVSSLEAGARSGTAYVNGELWTFDATDPVSVGEELVVSSVHGLKIHLRRRS